MHLLLTTALALAEEGLEAGVLPRDQAQLSFVVQLLQLAADSRQMLRDRKYRLPEVDSVVRGGGGCGWLWVGGGAWGAWHCACVSVLVSVCRGAGWWWEGECGVGG